MKKPKKFFFVSTLICLTAGVYFFLRLGTAPNILTATQVEAIELGWDESQVKSTLGLPVITEKVQREDASLVYEYQVRATNEDHVKVWIHFADDRVVSVYAKNKGLIGYNDDGIYGFSTDQKKWGSLRSFLPH